jgi:hypothetical protein
VRLCFGCCMPCHRMALHDFAFCGLFAARTHVALGIAFARISSVDIVLCHCPNRSSRIVPTRYPTLLPPPEQGTSNHTALIVLPGSTRLPTALQALLALKSDDPGALEAMVPKVSAMQKRGGGTGSLRAGLVRQVQNGLVVTGLGPRPHQWPNAPPANEPRCVTSRQGGTGRSYELTPPYSPTAAPGRVL